MRYAASLAIVATGWMLSPIKSFGGEPAADTVQAPRDRPPSSYRLTPNAPVEFVGMMSSGGVVKFALRNASTKASRWVEIGGTCAGYTLHSYDPVSGIIMLTDGQLIIRLALTAAKASSGLTIPGNLSPRSIRDLPSDAMERRKN